MFNEQNTKLKTVPLSEQKKTQPARILYKHIVILIKLIRRRRLSVCFVLLWHFLCMSFAELLPHPLNVFLVRFLFYTWLNGKKLFSMDFLLCLPVFSVIHSLNCSSKWQMWCILNTKRIKKLENLQSIKLKVNWWYTLNCTISSWICSFFRLPIRFCFLLRVSLVYHAYIFLFVANFPPISLSYYPKKLYIENQSKI